MLRSALEYPTHSDAREQFLVGSLLTLLGFLVVPAVFVAGYVLRAVREIVAGEERPPEWTDPLDLFVDGVRVVLVAVAYFFVPFVLLGLAAASILVVSVGPSSGVTPVGALVLVGVIASVPSLLVACYVLPAALVNVAVTGHTRGAFAFGRLWPVLKSEPYAVAWLAAAGVTVLAGLVAGGLSAVPVLGVVVAAPVGFYATLVTAHLYASGFDAPTPVVEDGIEPDARAVV